VKVLNVNSGKSGSLAAGFRYIAKMQITAITPTFGSALGGTDVLIDGIGFTSPVTVDVAGVRASVLNVTGTQIRVRTAATASPCAGVAPGPVLVTNVDNGDFDTSKSAFTYVGVPAIITSVSFPGATSSAPDPTVSSALTVNVQNPGVGLLGTATIAFTVGDKPAMVTPQTISTGTGTQPFTVVVPAGLTFPTIACTVGSIAGTKFGPASFAVTFTNVTTGCTTTKANAITITPEDTATHPNTCVLPPPPAASVTAPNAGCANAGSVAAAGGATGTATITILNSGGQPLTIAANPPISGANASDFTISPNTAKTVAPGASTTYTITFDPSATGSRNAIVTFTTNDPANANVGVCLTGTGT
jgi:hypothetical protein